MHPNNIPSAAEGGSKEMHQDGQSWLQAPQAPLQPGSGLGQGGNGGAVVFSATAPAQRPAAGEMRNGEREFLDSKGFFWEPVRSDEDKARLIESLTKLEEAKAKQEEQKTEREKLKQQGVPIPKQTDPESITLEWAMPKDIASLKLEYLVDPFLPAKCVVGFYGRGSTAKSSFLATLAAGISDEWSTLWISVEELTEWITQRHIRAGGELGTLAAFAYKAVKHDSQGRVIGSAFDVYRDLESAIRKAQEGVAQIHHPPRPLRLVVLDTAVGLTGWGKGESPNDDGAVKRLLGYLQALAEQHNLCIAIIGHANKGKHDHFADTVAGSSAWTNSPRLSFVHARDRREEYSYVMRVAKTNLSSSFAAAYSTEPVVTLHKHQDGHASVMCRVRIEPVVWGEEASFDLFEAATQKPEDSGGGHGGDHRSSLVENVLMAMVELVHTSGQTVTREMVHQRLGREVSRREWKKVDDRLSLATFQYKVRITTGPQNKAIYQKEN